MRGSLYKQSTDHVERPQLMHKKMAKILAQIFFLKMKICMKFVVNLMKLVDILMNTMLHCIIVEKFIENKVKIINEVSLLENESVE